MVEIPAMISIIDVLLLILKKNLEYTPVKITISPQLKGTSSEIPWNPELRANYI